MNVWLTFRLVPPVTPEAMAWAILSFSAYLAAAEGQPELFGMSLAPLALALVVQMILRITKSLTSQQTAWAFQDAPGDCTLILVIAFVALGVTLFFATDAGAARVFISYLLLYAGITFTYACYVPQRLSYFSGPWTTLKNGRVGAVKLQAAGQLVSAATCLLVWQLAGPLAFAAMMTFGVLALNVLINWVIVLYLLDLREQAADE